MKQITRLEETDMEGAVNKVLQKNKHIYGPVLIALCMKELKSKPSDFDRWEKQLIKYISHRIFKEGNILLRRDK